jgi:glucose-1-phosphate cytidylyltransferase
MRLREYSEQVPKPMATIGYRPILWHIMKYYAHYGHRDFILCLGWRADVIKSYFLQYEECLSNDFVMSDGGARIDPLSRDIQDWRVTFVDTGVKATIGERLRAVAPHLDGEETFLANYADGLTDLPLTRLTDFHRRRGGDATFLAVKPSQTFHCVDVDADGRVNSLRSVEASDVWINAGFFVLNRAVLEDIRPGEDLVVEPFRRLISRGALSALKHDGFFGCMDTFKEKQLLDQMYTRGSAPWQVWDRLQPAPPLTAPGSAAAAAPISLPDRSR